MRVVVAPDKFAGTLRAAEAAAAIREGWLRRSPADELVSAPMSDGGPGFIDVLHAVRGGERLAVTVAGPHHDPTPATVLLEGRTAFIESAQACGLHLVPQAGRDPEGAATVGVGELVAAAVAAGAKRIVVGLGGSGTNDAGAGFLWALGARADADLRSGARGLSGVTRVDLGATRQRMSGVELVAATDVDNGLLGMFGATKVYGPQKGLPQERVADVDASLGSFAAATLGPGVQQRKLADAAGAGAAGGLGFALLLLGASLQPGVELVAKAVGLLPAARGADLVVTGEGAFDVSSRAGKVVAGVAAVAAEAVRPCIVLAGEVLMGAREMRTIGVESAYAMVDLVGRERALADPADSLAVLAERAARTWSH